MTKEESHGSDQLLPHLGSMAGYLPGFWFLPYAAFKDCVETRGDDARTEPCICLGLGASSHQLNVALLFGKLD